MSITVRLPNGSEVDVQTDDPKQAAEAARKHWQATQGAAPAEDVTGPRKPRTALQTAGDFLGDTIDNVLPNWGDEVAAIPDAAKALFKGQDVGEAFDKGRHEFKANQAQYDEEHPWLAWGSTLTGLGASLALPAGRLVSGAGMAAKVAHGAAVGAGYGAVAGAGEGETLADRAANAGTGLAAGAALGGMASPLAEGAVRLGRSIRQNVPGVDSAVRTIANVPRAVMRRPLVQPGERAREQADRMMSREMNRGNIQEGMGQQGAPANPTNLLNEMDRRQAMGVPAMPADLTEGMRGMTSWASRGAGPGQTLVRNALDARKATEANRVRQHITDTFGPATNPVRQVQEYGERARRDAAPMYQEAYAQPAVVTPEMRAIMQTPAFRQALPNAVENIGNAMRDPVAMGFRIDDMGNATPGPSFTTEAFDQVIRAMRDNGRAAADINPVTGQVVNNTNSVNINARAGDLREQLAAHNGAYRDVTAMYADEMGMRDAFQRGQDIKNLTGPEIAEQFRTTPQANAREAWSVGARTSLADSASEYGAKYPTGDTAAMVRKLLGDEPKQAAIGQMTGRPDAVRGLQNRLEAEHQGNILWNDVRGNSKTAMRDRLDADLDEAAGVRSLSSLTPRGMLAAVVNHIASGATSQFRNDVKERVAQVATETNPENVADFMAAIADRARQDRDFADLLHRAGVIGTKAAAVNVAPPKPDDDMQLGSDGTRWHRGADGMMYNDDETFGYDPNNAH